MKNLLIAFLILVGSCTLCADPNVAQDQGSIRGTVVDEADVPIANARVNADPLDPRPGSSLVRLVGTDREGHFLIDRLEWGRYKIFAMKEDAGYPNMRASFYSDDLFPIITIEPALPGATVRIKLGPKAGVLTGSVANSATGAPVHAAGFKLTRAASPQKWISNSVAPDYRVLLPAATDILLEVSAPGFKAWTPGYPLRLQPGSEMHLDILLEPSPDLNLHPSRFLIPDGYVGWLRLEYSVKDAPPAPTENSVKVFRFPKIGLLNTSSPGPERGAENQFLFYSEDGSVRDITANYRSGGGLIWGQYEGSTAGVINIFGFFVGTVEQYQKERQH